MNRYQFVKEGLAPLPDLSGFLTDLDVHLSEKRILADRRDYIIVGLQGDRTPERYRRARFLADLDGMAAVGGYVPDFFCDTKIAEEFVEAGIAERLVIKGDDNVKRPAYRKLAEVPF